MIACDKIDFLLLSVNQVWWRNIWELCNWCFTSQGYTDEPIGKILSNIANSDTVLLDRWNLKVEPNPDASDSSDGKDFLPLGVVNNYFSLGVDAHIALEFHEARGKHSIAWPKLRKNSIISIIFFFRHHLKTVFLSSFRQRAIYTPPIDII